MTDRTDIGLATAADVSYQAGVADLAGRYGLSDAAAHQLKGFATLLVEDEHAPTTVRRPGPVRNDHLADALVALDLPEIRVARRIADLGSGPGVPGLPLAIALPDVRIALVEGNGRKCDFLKRAIELIGVPNASVVPIRAEAWADGMGLQDIVTARALASLDVVAEYAAPLLRVGGTVVMWRGKRDREDEQAGARAAAVLGLEVHPPRHVTPYPGAVNRHLHLMTKVAETPDRFPRRNGMARKRPLGRS